MTTFDGEPIANVLGCEGFTWAVVVGHEEGAVIHRRETAAEARRIALAEIGQKERHPDSYLVGCPVFVAELVEERWEMRPVWVVDS